RNLLRKRNRLPVAPQQLPARRPGTGLRQEIILLIAQHGGSPPRAPDAVSYSLARARSIGLISRRRIRTLDSNAATPPEARHEGHTHCRAGSYRLRPPAERGHSDRHAEL